MHAAAPCMDAAQHEFVLCADARPGSPAARMICCSIARSGLHVPRSVANPRLVNRVQQAHPATLLHTLAGQKPHAARRVAVQPSVPGAGTREGPHGLPTALEADVCTRHVGPHTYTRGADGDAEISTATHFGRARGSWTMWQMDSSGALLLLDASHVTTGLTLA